MATTYQAVKLPSGASEQMPGVGDGQSLKCVASTYNFSAAFVINDVIQSALIQAGSLIVDTLVLVSDLDSATSVTIDVGYGADPDYFNAASTVGQTGGSIRAAYPPTTAAPLLLTTNDTVDVLIKAAPGTPITTGTVTIIVFFLSRNNA